MDKEYKAESWFLVFLKDNYFFIYPVMFFTLISISTKSLLPILMVIGMIIVCIIFSILILFLNISTKKLIINEIIIVKKDIDYIFYKYKYKIIEFKTRGIYKGIYIIGENKRTCKLWKNEFKKNEWEEILENIKKYSHFFLLISIIFHIFIY